MITDPAPITLFLLILIVGKFSRLSEFGYDYLSNFILIKLLILFFISKVEKKNLNNIIYLLLFIYALSIKITAIFFVPILIYIIYENSNKINLPKSNIKYLFGSLVLFFLIENFLRSGCILYFTEFTCFDKNIVSWSIDFERVKDHSTHVELWAKAFYHQSEIIDKTSYTHLSYWFKNWFKLHFINKILLFVSIFITFLISIMIIEKFKIKKKINFKFYIISSLLSCFLWFYLLPQFRFGTGVLIALFISVILIFLREHENFKVKKKNFSIINFNNFNYF